MRWRHVRSCAVLAILAVGGPEAWAGDAAAKKDAKEPSAASFVREGIPFVQQHCLRCHGETKPKADLSLHSYRDEASIVKNRKTWERIVKMVQSGEMPPADQPKPKAEEIEAFLKAVQGVFVRNSKPDPGRVTIRRLNKAEYNNTIRDLFGINSNPAEIFPADDVGHGFDNNGDVLSLSPLLLEQYLAASEGIVARVFVSPQRGAVVARVGYHLEPPTEEARKGSKGAFRPLTSRSPLTYIRVPPGQDGEHTFRVRIYGERVDDEPVKAAILLNGKQLHFHEVKADDPKAPETLEHKVLVPAGIVEESLISLVLVNESKDVKGPQRTLWVESVTLIPPTDCRPAAQVRLFPVETGKAKPKQTQEILSRVATKAYRRPVTSEEVDRLVQLVETVEKRGAKWEDAMRVGIRAILVSPKFLFRAELDDRPDSAQQHPISEYQLASRLSYFLWSSMPDDELFALAEKQQLTANLDAQVQRMLKDPKARALIDNFAMQWLQMDRLQHFAPDPKLFPTFNEPLRKAMIKETHLFVEAVLREDRSMLDFIDADFTFLNEALAKHYGIADTHGNRVGKPVVKPGGQPIRGEAFIRVSLFDGERGGLLTQASILAAGSNPTRTSPVRRGNWVLEQILGTPPPPPPGNVPPLAETTEAIKSGSVRQRLEQHRTNPACANCHARIDPIGFAFENYDSIGAFRTMDGEFPIDPSATLPDGKSFKGPAELKAILKDKKELFGRLMTEKLLTYALGRGVEYYDQPTIERIGAALERNNYKISTLVNEIVHSDPFRLRRGKTQP